MSGFQIQPFPVDRVRPLFALDERELARHGARRVTAQADVGYPCRVGLRDVRSGESLIALSYEHLPDRSPYRASGPVFVSDTRPARPEVNEWPDMLSRRPLSLRLYDERHDMIDAVLVHGSEAPAQVHALLDRTEAAYLHVHLQPRGCFACEIRRAQ
ncbi:MAG: DUF1203 domain-containing protein [Myxococcales bacterium FL481]|nr:MAG: DUF1203 domain-containing protein [Myxococcales bacterium FL481]